MFRISVSLSGIYSLFLRVLILSFSVSSLSILYGFSVTAIKHFKKYKILHFIQKKKYYQKVKNKTLCLPHKIVEYFITSVEC